MSTLTSRVALLRRNLAQSDSLLHLLRSQIKQLKLNNDDAVLAHEEEALRRENTQLTTRVEVLRAQLTSLEAKNGLAQISLPDTETEASVSDTKVPRSDDTKQPEPKDDKKDKKKKEKEQKKETKQTNKHEPTKEAKSEGDESAKSLPAPDRPSLMQLLENMGITNVTIREHPPVFTVETMMPYLEGVGGVVGKNLFLKDKKKRLYLIAARHDAEVRLNDVAKQIGASGGLRLADESILFENLGVRQGCVNPYALANDVKGNVKLLLDKAMVDGRFDSVNFHPMSNAATLGVSIADFKKFMKEIRHEPVLIDL